MPTVISSKKKAETKKLDKDGELIATSLKRFKLTAEAEADWRKQALEDLKFSIGTGQWDEAVKSNREVEGKPCLTINRAPAFLRQYTGEERQHRPSMIVSPVGSGADIETAKIHQGVLRHIEAVSFADVVYDDAYDMMMRIGSCPWQITTDYVSDRSFSQEPRIEKIENPFASYISPFRRPDGTDPLWAHVIKDMSSEEYREQYGNSQISKYIDKKPKNFHALISGGEPEWITKDGVRLAQYWWLELERKTLVLLPDGSTRYKDELPKDLEDHIESEREVVTRKVCCVVHDAVEVLEEHAWLGRYIPLVEVNGVRLNVEGKIYKAGMVRDYRDAQRIYDFMVTRAVEQVDLTSKDPLWVSVDNAQWEEDYRNMNRKNFSHLYFKARDENGNELPPPQRAGREAPIQAMQALIQQADYDMKSVIGIYGPGLGEQGPDQESGFAILTRQQQSDTGAVSWHDNLNRAIRYQGKILLELWPKLIDAARVQRIINPDDSVKHSVVFNSQYQELGQGGTPPPEAQQLLDEKAGLMRAYDVGVGDYDVTLSTGPMYRTARQEAFRALTFVISQKPELLPVLGDVWAKNADFPDADVIESRLKKMLPPNLQDSDGEDLQSKLSQAESQLSAISQQYNQVVAELMRADDTIRTKRLDVESRERMNLLDNWTKILVQRMASHDEAAQSLMDAQLQAIAMRLQLLHGGQPVEEDAGAAPPTPELSGKVEPKVQPITPAAPVPKPQPIPGGI